MELLVLIALLLLGLTVLIRRRSYIYTTSTSRARAPAAVVIQRIADPAVAHRALVENADDFSDRPVAPFLVFLEKKHGQYGDGLASAPYGPLWRAFRCNITSETLHPSRLGHVTPLQREAIDGLVANLGKELPVVAVVRDHLYPSIFSLLARLCFGDDVDEGHVRVMGCLIREFQQVAVGEARASPGTMLAKLAEWRRLRRLLAIHGRLGELYLPLVDARRESRPTCDGGGRRPYVDSLIDLRVPDGGKGDGAGRRAVRDDEFVNLLSEFLGAGTGTVMASIEWTLAHLVNDQEIQKKLRDEVDGAGGAVAASSSRSLIRGMPYLNAVVLETLRLHPQVPFVQRHVHADAAEVLGVGGKTSGDFIAQFTVGDMGRDGKTWIDPDEFRPERFLPGGEAEDVGPLPGTKEIRMMPFGAGHRFCPGVGLAMMNIKCFLAALVHEFEWAPPGTEGCAGVDMTELNTFIKAMKKPLSARLTRRT
ncbi:unnamed protein product [Triticum turgidum subsp. durum]|uniref:Cytochrome P450 n=1 Tax=Triticum turgidum subsp. durum TaxID=4567 RepID=A0A9R0Z216_TRITD|nr:unnamed protein product [Triticum turgidum subsp. durum]